MRVGYSRQELELLESQTKDPAAQENFDRLQVYLEGSLMLRFNGDLFTVEFTKAETDFPFRHSLGYLPQDIWITSNTGVGVASINYNKTTTQDIFITTTAACVVRFFGGSFING